MGGLLTLGAVLALYFSSGAIEALRVGLNRAYETAETRPWWLLRLESIAYVHGVDEAPVIGTIERRPTNQSLPLRRPVARETGALAAEARQRP